MVPHFIFYAWDWTSTSLVSWELYTMTCTVLVLRFWNTTIMWLPCSECLLQIWSTYPLVLWSVREIVAWDTGRYEQLTLSMGNQEHQWWNQLWTLEPLLPGLYLMVRRTQVPTKLWISHSREHWAKVGSARSYQGSPQSILEKVTQVMHQIHRGKEWEELNQLRHTGLPSLSMSLGINSRKHLP